MPDQIRIAVAAMTSALDRAANIATALGLVERAAIAGADWVQLPEMFPFHGPYADNWANAEEEGGPLFQRLAEAAKAHRIVLFAGSVNEKPGPKDRPTERRADDHRVYNTSYVFGRDGSLIAKYRKIHLFNLRDEAGKPKYCESDGYLAGEIPVRTQVDGFHVGLSICYDLRFPELYLALSPKGAPPLDIITVPSAFTHETGIHHWEILLRARAIESQAYVFAANQVGTHREGRRSFGHGMVVDPWGEVLANTKTDVGFAMATVSRARIEETRRRVPALSNKRFPTYRP